MNLQQLSELENSLKYGKQEISSMAKGHSSSSAEQRAKQLSQLLELNKEAQEEISKLKQQLAVEQQQGERLEDQIQKAEGEYEAQLQSRPFEALKSTGIDAKEEQNEMDMNAWIESVQKFNGLPEEQIQMLVQMEYEQGPEADICLSCYKEMQAGEMCKYLPCCHILHAQCADDHLKISKVCPACMEEVVIL